MIIKTRTVAECSVSFHTLDIHVNITALSSVCAKSKAKSISTTLGNSIGEISLLSFHGFSNFLQIDIRFSK